jgi:3-oxoacyl-(acyl-carrier-protein) synthase/acyl carrier protein/NADP-dependent 3-hydroxy acid dehydrogenase YdfG/SAM-dependent methyltransferase
MSIESYVYSPHWKKVGNILNTALREHRKVLFLMATDDEELNILAASSCPNTPVFKLTSKRETAMARDSLLDGSCDQIVVLCATRYCLDIDVASIISFLGLLKGVSSLRKLRLDVITGRAVDCPAFVDVTQPADAVFVGLAKTLCNEFPSWSVRITALENLDVESLLYCLDGTDDCPNGQLRAIANRSLWLRTLEPSTLPPLLSPDASRFRQGGTYLIVGASGGLGTMMSRYLAETYSARLILVGRRASNDTLITELIKLGGTAQYICADIGEPNELKKALSGFAKIDGAIHSALILSDSTLANMSEEQLLSVLRPKLQGTLSFIDALRGHDPDFLLLFSSIQSFIANAGQANYTAACLAKDSIAAMARTVALIDTKVINWGYWGSIGVVSSEMYRKRMEKIGVGSIEPEDGIEVIERFLASEADQIVMLKASTTALKEMSLPENKFVIDIKKRNKRGAMNIQAIHRPIPKFDVNDPEVQYNTSASMALEEYTRSKLSSLKIPDKIADRHHKLVSAIGRMSYGKSYDKQSFIENFPGLSRHAELLEECMQEYPKILEGHVDPLSVMFPGGSFRLVEPVYRNNPIADYFNNIVCKGVRNIADSSASPIRVIEIGAGTGSTADVVLSNSADRLAEYRFTDLSHAFLNSARRKYGRYDCMSYEIIDIEEPIAEEVNGFDVVIATNVLHATKDIRRTLENVRRLLRDGGVLLLNEITSRSDFATATFGLTEGWWLSSDCSRIDDSPLLTSDMWTRYMKETGFGEVYLHGDEGQCVFAAVAARAEPALQSGLASKQNRAAEVVLSAISSTLHMESAAIELDRPFSDFGIDSLIALEILEPMKQVYGGLSPTILFEFPTVEKLATYFANNLTDLGKFEIGTVLEFSDTFEPPEMESNSEPFAESSEEEVIKASPGESMAFLKNVLTDVLHLDPATLEDERPFSDYGVDSLISLEILTPIRDLYGDIPSTAMFEYPTLRKFADHLASLPNAGPSFDVEDSHDDKPESDSLTDTAPINPQHVKTRISGMAARLPDATSLDEFWQNISEGRDSFRMVPKRRWDAESRLNENPSLQGGAYTNRGAFIEDIECFDHGFFRIIPSEAERMDPQERVFLEVAYNAFLDAGHTMASLRGRNVGVFLGVMNGAYSWFVPEDENAAKPTSLFWSIANRVSYSFDLKGPSMAIDTACSSSMTALHLARQALASGDCDMALVGGVNMIVHPNQYENLCRMHMLSRDGVCRPFGNGADGFVDGEGVCAVVLEKDGLELHPHSEGVPSILATAVNSGGQAMNYSAPNPKAQAALISLALERGGVKPSDIDYIETHGTGTDLGDPIEIQGIALAFNGAEHKHIPIGSLKSNIGHLESAAGLAGILKTAMQMRHGEIVPTLHSENENLHLKLQVSKLVLAKERIPLVSSVRSPTYACVSSFGAGGSNAHAILESKGCLPTKGATPGSGSNIFPLSSKTLSGLHEQVAALSVWLEDRNPNLADLSFTLSHLRDHFAVRVCFVCSNKRDLLSQLYNFEHIGNVAEKPSSPFDFPAQGRNLALDYIKGMDINWRDQIPVGSIVSAPGYMFEKDRHWIKNSISIIGKREEMLIDHVVKGVSLVPAAFSLAMFNAAAPDNDLVDVKWTRPINSLQNINLSKTSHELHLLQNASTSPASSAKVENKRVKPISNSQGAQTLEFIRSREIYQRFEKNGYSYGETFQGLRWAQVRKNSVRAFINVKEDWGFPISPALIDAGMQCAILLPDNAPHSLGQSLFVPSSLERFSCVREFNDDLIFVECNQRESRDYDSLVCDIVFMNAERETFFAMEGLVSTPMDISLLTMLESRTTESRSSIVIERL